MSRKGDFKSHWKNYVLQSLGATVAMFLVLLVLSLQQAVITASIGATAFIVFAMPNSVTARPWNVVGGHVVGLISGACWSLVPHSSTLMAAVIYACAVGLTFFVMVVINAEHPPAAGTALGVAIGGCSWPIALAIVTSVALLALLHKLLRPYLRDLV
jgi:CBS-domain-containing membrane protein